MTKNTTVSQKKSDKKDSKKIGLIGLGPVGMILAVHLQESGFEVAICDNDKIKVNLIRSEGIRLEGVIDKQCYFKQVYTSISELSELDLDILIVSVKTHQMQSVLNEAEALRNDKLFVVSAQNGIDVERIASAVFGDSNTLRMVVNFAGNLNAPNIVKVTFFNPPNYLASIDDSHEEIANSIADWLNSVNLHTEVVNSFEILKRIWEKTILNASLSALCGIGKLTMKEAMDMPDTVEIIEQVIEEAIEVADAEKIKFDDDFIRKCLRYLRKAGNHFPSLAVDLINNRETEIDYFNGKIVEYGRKHYIRTSLNLVFTNMVHAITHKQLINYLSTSDNNLKSKMGIGQKEGGLKRQSTTKRGPFYLGIDLGSVYTKFSVIDDNNTVVMQSLIKTLNRDRIALKHVLQTIHSDFDINYSCATGYGRKHFPDAEIIKTEINCAAVGGANSHKGAKTIIDIGGEDIKVIRCDEKGNVENFYLNDKCAAGTGSFITEISERAEVEISEMSDLASKSNFKKEINSFCTVFAKTEIMGWLFDGVAKEDIARGIYISIANRVSKLRVDLSVPVYLVGGVAAYHPFLKNLLEEKFQQEVKIIEKPIYVVSFGAALIAKKHFQNAAKEIVVEDGSSLTN